MTELIDLKEKALAIANKYYPNVKCVILTGSQTQPKFLSSQSDIDILLIDTLFNHVSSDGLKEESYKIDFTRVDFFNLIKILVDYSYSINPIIIYMLKDGLILRDETGVGKLAKKYAERIADKGNNDYHNELRNLKLGLTKLKKNFLKKLDIKYHIFLLGDFLRLMASSYLFIRDCGWAPNDGFRQVKHILIKEENAPFLDEMVEISNKFLKEPYTHTHIILKYIDKYLNFLTSANEKCCFEKKLILNVNFRNQNLDIFYKDICYSILNNSYLSKYFTFGHVHNQKHVFKNEYCLHFNKNLESYSEIHLLEELEKVFFKERKRILSFSIINPNYIYELIENEIIYTHIENLLSCINKEIVKLVRIDNSHNKNKVFLIGLSISILLIRSLKLEADKIQLFAYYLMQKIIPEDFIQHVGHSHIIRKKNKYISSFICPFQENSNIFEELRRELIDNSNVDIYHNVDLPKINSYCIKLADEIINNKNATNDLCILTVDIKNTNYKEKQLFWYLSNSIELILDTIGLDNGSRSYFAYALGKLYN